MKSHSIGISHSNYVRPLEALAAACLHGKRHQEYANCMSPGWYSFLLHLCLDRGRYRSGTLKSLIGAEHYITIGTIAHFVWRRIGGDTNVHSLALNDVRQPRRTLCKFTAWRMTAVIRTYSRHLGTKPCHRITIIVSRLPWLIR